MRAKKVSDILADYADELNADEVPPEAYLAVHPEERGDWAPLLDIAARAKQTLEPVSPPPEFRARLRAGLLTAAQRRAFGDLQIRQRSALPWGWLIGAVALGGLLVLVLRHGRRSATCVSAHSSV
jgi:hypothetical protein